MEQEQRFKAWAILELFGHKVMAGEVSEANIAGAVMVQINVPDVPAITVGEGDPSWKRAQPALPKFTKFFSPAAIYGITPTTEDVARGTAARLRAAPVDAFDITTRPGWPNKYWRRHMANAKPEPCNLCGGTAGQLLDGAHCLCTARAALSQPTPSLGDRCPACNGSGTTGRGGVFLDFSLGPQRIARSIAAQFPPCQQCAGTGTTLTKVTL